MAKFDPFAYGDADKRLPTPTEREHGFPCGPLDQALFNMMFNRIEGELGDLIDYAGITGSDADYTQVRQAVLALIAAAITGIGSSAGSGIDTSLFVLMNQARARLPLFPEIQTGNGKMGVTSTGAGNVRIPAGVNFQHRGIFPVTTTLTDFATAASKTYHLRWNPTDGYALKDCIPAGAYNPGSIREDDPAFDSTYDDMLIARIVTNGANLPTIDNLVNKIRLVAETVYESNISEILDWTTGNEFGGAALYWSRKPIIAQPFLQLIRSQNNSPTVGAAIASTQGSIMSLGVRPRTDAGALSRYGAFAPQVTYQDSARNDGRYRYSWVFVGE